MIRALQWARSVGRALWDSGIAQWIERVLWDSGTAQWVGHYEIVG